METATDTPSSSRATGHTVVRRGNPCPWETHCDGHGMNFSVFSGVAPDAKLCLFDDGGREQRIRLPEVTAFCRHGYLPAVGPGQRYGFRVAGPWAPMEGHRCNASTLLLDSYARAIDTASDAWFASQEPLAPCVTLDGPGMSLQVLRA